MEYVQRSKVLQRPNFGDFPVSKIYICNRPASENEDWLRYVLIVLIRFLYTRNVDNPVIYDVKSLT